MAKALQEIKLYIIKNKGVLFTLLAIFIIALALRLIKLGTLPHDPHEDEIMSGYIGRFILQNGKDVYGNSWPLLYFNKFGDYYIILPMYLAGLATYLFGITVFAVRFPAAIMGALAIFPVYLVSLEVFKNKKIALISAFLLAITPWHIVLSRASSEGIIGSTIFMFGIFYLLTSLRLQNLKKLFAASAFFLLSYFIYHPFRIYAPLVMLGGAILFNLYKQIKPNKKYILTFAVLTFIFFSLTFYISSTPWGKGRFVQTSILSAQSGVSIKINNGIYGDGSILEARMFHNKLIGYSREFITQYFSYLSPNFLFISGGNYSRYSVAEDGLLYLAFLVSLIVLYKMKPFPLRDKRGLFFLIFLALLSIFPSALTVVESPNVHRTVFFCLALMPFFGFTFYQAYTKKFKFIPLHIVLAVMIVFEFFYFFHQYSVHTDSYVSIFRNDGQSEAIHYLLSVQNKYDKIYITKEGTMSMYYLFYKKDFNPAYITKFKSDVKLAGAGNVVFSEKHCPTENIPAKTISKKSLVIEIDGCGNEPGYTEIAKIYGANPLIFYKALVPNK